MELPKIYNPNNVEEKWYEFWLKNNVFSPKDDDDTYTIIVEYPLNNWNSKSFDDSQSLSGIISYYRDTHNVEITMDDNSITFISNRRIILSIFESLMFSGRINIWPNEKVVFKKNISRIFL